MSLNILIALLNRWWEMEPEYTQPFPTTPEETRTVCQAAFFDLAEAIGRRDWRWRIEEDDMWIAAVSGEGGNFAKAIKGLSTAAPDHVGMLDALLTAYLGAVLHPENRKGP